MATFAADFWEIATDSQFIEAIPADRALWFETDEDRDRRYALQDFFQAVLPVVTEYIEESLTDRQREIVQLYFFHGKTQEDIAAMLDVSQSTVSRHLFGTTRDGKKVGGAIPKLRKVVERTQNAQIQSALGSLQDALGKTA